VRQQLSVVPLEAQLTLTCDVTRGSDFAVLCKQVREANLLARRRVHYAVRTSVTFLAFAASWAAFVVIGDSWLQLLVAAVLGIVTTQVAFMGHDSGHQQICSSRRGNDALSLVAGDLLVGLSFGWWTDKHNRHHANPNTEGKDPDIGEGVLVWTDAQVDKRTGRVQLFIARHEAWLFFPLLTLEGLNLHVSAATSLIKGKTRKYRRTEIALFSTHVVVYLAAVFLILGPAKGFAFIAINQAVFGLYMGCSFAPNHKGMPIIPAGSDIDFLKRQVLTSRNVRGGWFTDLLLGGLNYQVEHHLFPSMPRPSLRKAQHLVRGFCAEHDIPYTETSLVGSYAAALRGMHALGAPLRVRRRMAFDPA
jgi:fatty acid desaturase